MKVDVYNEKLLLVAAAGDLSTSGILYREYQDAFDEWYGESIPEDSLIESGYPENDFREWFKSRLIDVTDVIGQSDPEIREDHLDEELIRIRNVKRDFP